MSDIKKVAELVDSAGTHMFSLVYTRKDGTEGRGVFHAKVKYNLHGGEDSTKAYAHYRSLYNVQKKRWSKVNLKLVKRIKVNGKTYNFEWREYYDT